MLPDFWLSIDGNRKPVIYNIGVDPHEENNPNRAYCGGQSSAQYALADYAGDFAKRSYLLGDFGGKRSEWAKKGFTFDIDYNPYFQAVVDCRKTPALAAPLSQSIRIPPPRPKMKISAFDSPRSTTPSCSASGFPRGFGKYDAHDSANEFSGGRGKSLWWNENLTVPERRLPLQSVLGAPS